MTSREQHEDQVRDLATMLAKAVDDADSCDGGYDDRCREQWEAGARAALAWFSARTLLRMSPSLLDSGRLASVIESSGHLPAHPSDQVNVWNAQGIADAVIAHRAEAPDDPAV
ncbi:hypothetical protein [Aeromicrobium sp. CTD01-1L150]|uniref:hypothetical protein n=1 Tax=Aeromicrobium sp. CTD01-1L150 TaxID=3341830 RepID=UPI0035C015A2